ncbi:MAG: hypothetical protein L6Q71_02435 [Planctomycetes bacterium]|nr:hypothetical protein [Planctomycetota bacterium]
MPPEVKIGTQELIQRLLRQEHGTRKCARIMLFMNRQQLIPIIIGLPVDVLIAIAREMAKLKSQLVDLMEERERMRSELGLLAEVLDFSPPERKAHEAFGFLDDISPQALVALATELDPHTLATLACHASADAAIEMIAGIRQLDVKTRLVNQLTRVKPLGKRSDGLGITAGTLDFTTARYALPDLLGMLDGRAIQGVLGSMQTHVLALAIATAESAVAELLRANLSSGRLEDVEAEIKTYAMLDEEEGRAARRAIAKRLVSLMRDG